MGKRGKNGDKTKEKIIREFWKLYQKTEMDKITVKKITDASGVYRTTFYLHFSDIYEVLKHLEKELMEHLNHVHAEKNMTEEQCRQSYVELCRVVNEDKEYLRVLLERQEEAEFAAAYSRALTWKICQIYQINFRKMDEEAEMIVREIVIVTVDVLLRRAGTRQCTFEEMFGVMEGFLKKGILETLSGNSFYTELSDLSCTEKC